MTDIASEPFPAAADEAWTQQLDALKVRYKHVREPVLVALNILLREPNVGLDDAKAQASVHGVRITAASVNAARTLLARMDTSVEPTVMPPAPSPARSARRPRAAEKGADAEALIRGFVEKLQGQGNAEAERLRAAVRKAIAALEAVLKD